MQERPAVIVASAMLCWTP
jgi:hypothetical protein